MIDNKGQTFNIFPWNKNFETGIPLIDEQHKKLIDLLNELGSHLIANDKIELTRIFEELAAYADYHFKTEESIWGPYFKDDDWFIEHQKTHGSFLPEALKIKETDGKPFEHVVEDIIKFLIHWLAYHILDSDKRMAIVLQQIDSGQSLEQAKKTSNKEMSDSVKMLIDTVLSMYDSLSARTLDLMREIEDRKQAEDALRKSTEELNELKGILEKKIEIAEGQLFTSQKLAAIGELSAGVCHEVLNPLNIISIQNQMLGKRNKDNEAIQLFSGKVNFEIERIKKILGSLLEFSRQEEPKFEKGFLKVDIEKMLSLVEEEYKLDNIQIERCWCSEPVSILYDHDKMRQVFLNLLQNAKYAMPNGGIVTLSCEKVHGSGKGFLRFKFSDNGPGMSEEVASNIFNPFFTTKPQGEGTGLGLAIVHGIIQEHGGEISVETAEGKGTTFLIDLPIAD